MNPALPVPSLTSITDTMTDMRSSYEASRETKFLRKPADMPTWGTGEDHHTAQESDFWYMVEFSRHVERNDPVVGQGVGRFTTNVVQNGYAYKPETGVDRIDRQLKDRWGSWTDSDNRIACDYSMEKCWNDFERLSVRRTIFDGDCGFNPMANGSIQGLECHRIRTPIFKVGGQSRRRRYVHLGVEKNRKDQVARYWITKNEDTGLGIYGGGFAKDNYAGVMAWDLDELTGRNEQNFFHMFMPNRMSQTRGVTTLAPVLNTAGMHGDVQFAKLVQQQMVSYVSFTHEVPFSTENYSPPQYAMEPDPYTGQMRPKAPDLAPGSEYWSHYPGEKITPFSANIPNAEFFDQARMLLTFISLQLGMPLILFLLDASETNFSSWRAATDQAKLSFVDFQRQHARRFHDPVLRWKQRRWLRQDRELRNFFALNGPDFFNHEWGFPGWPYVEPLKDVQADAAEMGANLSSPRRILARRKLDFNTIADEIALDNEYIVTQAMEAAARINKHPYVVANPDEKIGWREIAHPNMGDDLQMQILDKNDASSNDRADDPKSEPAGTAA